MTTKIGLVAIGIMAVFVVLGMTAAVIDTNESPACAAPKQLTPDDEFLCADQFAACRLRCDKLESRSKYYQCQQACSDQHEICMNVEMEVKPGGTMGTSKPLTPQGTATPTSPPPRGTGQPKDPGGLSPVDTGVVKDPGKGTGNPPKGLGKVKDGLNKVDAGLMKQPSGPSGGSTTIFKAPATSGPSSNLHPRGGQGPGGGKGRGTH